MPLNWTSIAIGGRADISNRVSLNFTVKVSNNSYQYSSVGDFQFSDISNRNTTFGLNTYPARHLRIYPIDWVGSNPCLRFEAFFSIELEK
jgi:hypothetical protein